jgi:hypothetical protein
VLLERLPEQHPDHRRHQRALLHPVLLDQRHEAGGVEPAHEHAQPGLDRVQPGHRHHQPVDVGQGQRQQPADPAGHVPRGVAGRAGGVQRGVREGDALAPAGRAAGVEQRGEVVVRRSTSDSSSPASSCSQGTVPSTAPPTSSPEGSAHDHHRLAARRRLHLRQELRRRHERDGARVLGDVPQLGLGEQEQHRRGDAPARHRAL